MSSDPPTAVAAILPTFIVAYPAAHPTAAPTAICLGAGARERSFRARRKVPPTPPPSPPAEGKRSEGS